MRKSFILIATAVLFAVCASCSKEKEPVSPTSDTETTTDPEDPSDPTDPETPEDPEVEAPEQNGSGEVNGYTLVWEDLFDAESLDKAVWNIEVNGNGGGNNELQYYLPDNLTMGTESESNRHCLIITAKKESYMGKSATSGRINTKGNVYYKHGKVEAMIKMPETYKGLWPAFWMMGNDFDQVRWPACGEIDIVEMGNVSGFQTKDKSESFLNGACHWGANWEGYCSYGPSTTYDYSLQDGFHLFTLIWDEKSVKCYVDLDKYPNAEPYYQIDIENVDTSEPTTAGNYFHKPFFIIFNLAVGGNFPQIWDISGITALNASNGYEASMYIDYVKVYQKN